MALKNLIGRIEENNQFSGRNHTYVLFFVSFVNKANKTIKAISKHKSSIYALIYGIPEGIYLYFQ